MTVIGEVAIIIVDRQKSAGPVNELLTRYGDLIIARMGIPHRENNLYIISIVVEGDGAKISEMTEKLSLLPKVKVKSITI